MCTLFFDLHFVTCTHVIPSVRANNLIIPPFSHAVLYAVLIDKEGWGNDKEALLPR